MQARWWRWPKGRRDQPRKRQLERRRGQLRQRLPLGIRRRPLRLLRVPNKFTGGDSGVDDDVFVHDRKTGKTARASVKSNGKEAASPADSDSCSLSADGRLVAFLSDGALVGGDTNGYQDVYVHNMDSGKTTRVSVKSDGSQVFADSQDPRISANGRYVAWDSDGAFSGADVNGYLDVYRHDLKDRQDPAGESPG